MLPRLINRLFCAQFLPASRLRFRNPGERPQNEPPAVETDVLHLDIRELLYIEDHADCAPPQRLRAWIQRIDQLTPFVEEVDRCYVASLVRKLQDLLDRRLDMART